MLRDTSDETRGGLKTVEVGLLLLYVRPFGRLDESGGRKPGTGLLTNHTEGRAEQLLVVTFHGTCRDQSRIKL